mmetsp:Transcript_34129/g.51481  ORF Transcript_34129/g.51481 Transcript_34129/m.51481 type:complete len:401 (+) Transcript_34129:959-2161(+)
MVYSYYVSPLSICLHTYKCSHHSTIKKGHPNFVHIGEELSKLLSSSNQPKQVVVIGQGNVALDCARILAKGKQGLIDTDIASHALDVIGDGIEKTIVLGRRGHVQGAFTIKELRELTKLKKEGHNVAFNVRQDELDMGATPSTMKELNLPGARPKVRIDKLLRDVAAATDTTSGADTTTKEVDLRFLLQPMTFLPDELDPSRVGSLVCQRTELKGEPRNQVAVATGEEETFPVSLVLVSIGYKGVPLPELEKEDLFDYKKGIVRNNHGKVTSSILNTNTNSLDTKGGLYVSGWLKRGPSGIIGTNISDAKDTVASILFDLKNGNIFDDDDANKEDAVQVDVSSKSGRDGLNLLLKERGVKIVDWDFYRKIDAEEKTPGRLRSERQPREKITSVQEMLQLL